MKEERFFSWRNIRFFLVFVFGFVGFLESLVTFEAALTGHNKEFRVTLIAIAGGIAIIGILSSALLAHREILEDERAKLENYRKFVEKFVKRNDIFLQLQLMAQIIEEYSRKTIDLQTTDKAGYASLHEERASQMRSLQDEFWRWVAIVAITGKHMPGVLVLQRESFKDYLPDKQAQGEDAPSNA